MAAPGWGSRPGAGGREGAGSRARPAAARKSARGTGRWSRGSRGGGEPRAPASKTRGRKREKRRGGAGGDRGFCPRRAFRKLPGPRASPAEVPALPAPQPGGVCRIISPSPASLSEPRPPPPSPAELAGPGGGGGSSPGRAAPTAASQSRGAGGERGGRRSRLQGLGIHTPLPPSSFGLRRRERAEETGLLLSAPDLRQRVPSLPRVRVGEPSLLPRTPTSTRGRCIPRLLPSPSSSSSKRERRNRGQRPPSRPASPRPAGEDRRRLSRPVSLSVGKEPRRSSRGGWGLRRRRPGPGQRRASPPPPPAPGVHPRGAGPAPPGEGGPIHASHLPSTRRGSARRRRGPVVKGEIFPRRPPERPAEGRGCSRSAARSAGY